MPLETGNFIDDLVTTNPPGTDGKSQGDDHLRLIKLLVKNTFPNGSRAFRFPEVPAATTTTPYNVAAADDNRLVLMDATTANATVALQAAATAKAGFLLRVMKIDVTANTVTIDGSGAETINGTPNIVLSKQYQMITLLSTGSTWFAFGQGDLIGLAAMLESVGGSPGLPAVDGSQLTGSPGRTTGDIDITFKSTTPTGWIPLDGATLGETGSGATHSGAAYQALYDFLWDEMANAQAPVSSGRGASSAADWAALKTLTIPDAHARSLVGVGSGGGLNTYVNGETAGSENAIVVSHTHADTFSVVSGGAHSHKLRTTNDIADQWKNGSANTDMISNANPTIFGDPASATETDGNSQATDTVAAHSHTLNGSVSSAGSSGTDANIPPVLAAYVYIKL